MFRLLRYFSLASLAFMLVAALLLGALYRQVALGNLVEMGERANVALARTLANALRADFDPLVGADAAGLDSTQRAQLLTTLSARITEYTRGMSVVKIKIYDPGGITVFSSEAKQIGEDKRGNKGFLSALAGTAASELSHRDKFSAFEQVIENRDLISSYVPIRRAGQLQAYAVFEVYDDVTPLLGQLSTTLAQIIAGVLLVLAGLYGVLFAVVRRADRILREQHATLVRHERQLLDAADTLEHRVTERTRALTEVNDQLNAEVEQRREAECGLIEARRSAEAASLAKSQFLSTMSHEIRTPLNGVLGMSELLRQSRLDADQTRYVNGIASAGLSLHGLLSDVLDLAKIEEGQVQLEKIDFDLSALLTEAHAMYRDLASDRGLELALRMPNIPGRASGDPGRLRQVLTNLLGNAVKFTERGQIELACEQLPTPPADASTWWRISVTDSGVGVAPGAVESLFQRFVQADTSTTREFGGSGLGLVICKHLIELMGGSIHVESTPGRGSRFWFDLPLHPPLQALSPKTPVNISFGDLNARVLIAEDNPVNQQVITGLLAHLGIEGTVAVNGADALKQIQDQPFDLVFMDCQMPVMDGFEATRRLRAWEAKQSNRMPAVVVALTANALSGDREVCLAAGMNDYATKPLSLPKLIDVLERHLRHRGGGAASSRATSGLDGPDACRMPDFDPSVLAALPMVSSGTDPEFATRLIRTFLDTAATTLHAMKQALHNDEQHDVVALVHSLKSAAAQVGALALAQEAEIQERLLRGGAAAASDLVERFSSLLALFELALQHWNPSAKVRWSLDPVSAV